MKRHSAVMLAAAVICSTLLTGASVAAGPRAAVTTGGTWGIAKEVPGTATLNKGGSARASSVSCGAAGNCAAVGFYTDGSGHQQAFVVNQTNGTWGTAKEVPGTTALNKGGFAGAGDVSCPSAGNCAAGGGYTDGSGHSQAFVVNEVNGTWGTATEVPGTAALNTGGSAGTGDVSCPSAGNCAAGGLYKDGSGHYQAFVVSETNGRWGTAKPLPSVAALNKGGIAAVDAMSCPSVGNCAAGGLYKDSSGHDQVFVIGEVNGTWGTAKEVPGTAALNTGGLAEFNGARLISCASAGNCSAGGMYSDTPTHQQAFVVSETNGRWGTAREVPGTAALNLGSGDGPETNSISCASAGNCSAGGIYDDRSNRQQVFVVGETNGVWGTAKEAPGIAALNQGGFGLFESISCASVGNCSAGGQYSTALAPFTEQAFVISEVNGMWGIAKEVPGTAALNSGGYGTILSVSCASAAHCSAGGRYRDSSGHLQAFVVTKT